MAHGRRGRRAARPSRFKLVLISTAVTAALLLGAELAARRGPPPEPGLPDEQLLAFRESSGPFFRVRWRGFERVLEQVPQQYAYVPPQTFALAKAPDRKRILVLGESSAVALGRALRALLEGTAEADGFEVMNCGTPGGTLEEVELRLRECVRYSPDMIVFFFGHNLFYASPTPRAWSFRLVRLARKSRLFARLADRLAEPDSALPAEERRRALEKLIRRVGNEARRRGIPWVGCTVPSNLRYPPLANEAEFRDPDYLQAKFLHLTGRRPEAIGKLRMLLREREAALWHFELGDWLLQAGDAAGARKHLLLSRDRDEDRNQATTEVNGLIRRAVEAEGGWLLDLAELIASRAPDGIPGWESFDDEQHVSGRLFDVEAAALLDLVRLRGGPAPAPPRRDAGPGGTQPFEDFLDYAVQNVVHYDNPFARALAFKLEYALRSGEPGLKENLEVWVSTRARVPAATPAASSLWRGVILLRAAEGFWRAGDRPEAWRLNRVVARGYPHWEEPHVQRGLFLLAGGRTSAAGRAFRRALALNPARTDAEFYAARCR